MSASTSQYPVTKQAAATEWVPSLLRTFIELVVSEDFKQVLLYKAIVRAARPRSVFSSFFVWSWSVIGE